MKSWKDISENNQKKPQKNTYNWVKKPTPISRELLEDVYVGICRIFPFYIAENYKYFELLTCPKQKIKDKEGYIRRIREKINRQKAEFLL